MKFTQLYDISTSKSPQLYNDIVCATVLPIFSASRRASLMFSRLVSAVQK